MSHDYRHIGELTQGERRVLPYLVAGLDCRQIAAALCLSWRTVRHYRETIESKLHCASSAQLAAFALLGGHVAQDEVADVWRRHAPHLTDGVPQ